MYMNAGSYRDHRSQISQELEPWAVVSHLTWMLEPNSGPLEGQYVLSTIEPSVQPLPSSSCAKDF